jgi:cobalt-precorrin-5B (C1)-methyltransferase
VIQAIDVAVKQGLAHLVLTTGGKSETYAMRMLPELAPEAFIQMGDFVGVAVKHCARRGVGLATIVGMIGKLSKMADGKMQTHAAGSEVNTDLLASLAAELGAGDDLCGRIRQANTARHVLEMCKAEGFPGITSLICRKLVEYAKQHAGGALEVEACLVDFDGAVLGRYPEEIL